MNHSTITDSEFILPDIPPDNNNEDSNPKDENNLQIPLNPNTNDDTDTDVKIKVEVEVGELFMGRSIEETDDTVFPSGLILIHDQSTVTLTLTASDSRTETRFISCTPVYMAENQTPSYLQTSTPNTSIIRTNHSEIRFVQQGIPPGPSGSARSPPPKDPLSTASNGDQSKRVRNPRTWKNPHKCTLCEITFSTDLERQNHLKISHKNDVRSKAEEKRYKCTLCELSFRLAELYDHIIAVHANQQHSDNTKMSQDFIRKTEAKWDRKSLVTHETPEQRKKRLATKAERQRKCMANETLELRRSRLARHAELQKNYLADETPEQRIARLEGAATSGFVQCEYCEKSFAPRSLRDHIVREHSKTEDKKFKCDHCEKTFAIERDCKVHMLTHSKEKRFICEKCGKCFKGKETLKHHIIFKHRYDEDVQEKYWQKQSH